MTLRAIDDIARWRLARAAVQPHFHGATQLHLHGGSTRVPGAAGSLAAFLLQHIRIRLQVLAPPGVS